jgi:hypothetical protein
MSNKKKPAKPAAKKKPAKSRHERRSQPMTTNEEREQASTAYAEEREQQAQAAISAVTNHPPFEDMSKDTLVGILQGVEPELRRLMEVEERYNALMGDLEKEAGDDERPWTITPELYTRGKLPGGQLIATEREGGAFHPISQDEWDRIPAK